MMQSNLPSDHLASEGVEYGCKIDVSSMIPKVGEVTRPDGIGRYSLILLTSVRDHGKRLFVSVFSLLSNKHGVEFEFTHYTENPLAVHL